MLKKTYKTFPHLVICSNIVSRLLHQEIITFWPVWADGKLYFYYRTLLRADVSPRDGLLYTYTLRRRTRETIKYPDMIYDLFIAFSVERNGKSRKVGRRRISKDDGCRRTMILRTEYPNFHSIKMSRVITVRGACYREQSRAKKFGHQFYITLGRKLFIPVWRLTGRDRDVMTKFCLSYSTTPVDGT